MPRSKSRTVRTTARRRRPTASRPRKQRGGSRTVLPISYFGGNDSAAYTGKCGRSPIQTAYGSSVPTSFGELGTSLGAQFAGPDLAPGSGVEGVSASALQTGGARRRRKSVRRPHRRQPTRRSRARRSHRTRTRARTQRGGSLNKTDAFENAKRIRNDQPDKLVSRWIWIENLGKGYVNRFDKGRMMQMYKTFKVTMANTQEEIENTLHSPFTLLEDYNPMRSDDQFLLVRTNNHSTGMTAAVSATLGSANTTGVIRTTIQQMLTKKPSDPFFADNIPGYSSMVPYYVFDKVYTYSCSTDFKETKKEQLKQLEHKLYNLLSESLSESSKGWTWTSGMHLLLYPSEVEELYELLHNSQIDTITDVRITDVKKKTYMERRTLYKIQVTTTTPEGRHVYIKLKTYSDFAELYQRKKIGQHMGRQFPYKYMSAGEEYRKEFFQGMMQHCMTTDDDTRNLLYEFLQEDDGVFFALHPKQPGDTLVDVFGHLIHDDRRFGTHLGGNQIQHPIPAFSRYVIRVMRGGTIYFYKHAMDYDGYDDGGKSRRGPTESTFLDLPEPLKLVKKNPEKELWLHLDLPAQKRLFQRPNLTTCIPLEDGDPIFYEDTTTSEKLKPGSVVVEGDSVVKAGSVKGEGNNINIKTQAGETTTISYDKLLFRTRRLPSVSGKTAHV